MSKTFIAYYRVSTQRQGQSGLGIEAQHAAVEGFLAGHPDAELLAEFLDVESGKKNERPKLQEALSLCRVTGATLLIAKLDRLSRNAAFMLNLKESGVQFMACDMPHADAFTVGVMALLAQKERELISERTKAALAAAKARGVKLGGYRGNAFGGDFSQGGKAVAAAADKFAASVAGYIRQAQKSGASLRGIADTLNRQGIKTARGGLWYASTVRGMLARLDVLGL